MKKSEIIEGKNKLIINSCGARIESLILEGQEIFTKVVRGDGKEGSSHPCIPQFGPETTTSFGLPQHGSARNKDFELSTSDNEIILSQNIEDGKYPKGLSIDQKHGLTGGEYSLITTISNNSDLDLPVNFAEHFYWATPNGWEGLRINGINVADAAKKDSSIKLLPENEIEIPGQKAIILKQTGFSIFRLWAYKNSQTGEYDRNYVCIEPAEGDPDGDFFGSEKSMIKPHESRVTEIFIKLNG